MKLVCVVGVIVGASLHAAAPSPTLQHYAGSRMSMACLYAIEAYGPGQSDIASTIEEALDEVDRIDRLMSHYKRDSPLSRLNRDAGRGEVTVEPELFSFVAEALRYNRESDGAFDITVGPLMKAWGFFGGDGRLPSDAEIDAARRLVGGSRVRLNHAARTIAFDTPGVELDLGGIAKGYAVDRAAAVLSRRGVKAARISAGGSSIYGMGAPPGRKGWVVDMQDPRDSRKTAMSVSLKDRALSIAGRSEKSFEVDGVVYSHIMDPRTGRPVQGILSVAVLSETAVAGDALDDAFFVLGPEGSRSYLRTLPGVEAMFFSPAGATDWKVVRRHGGPQH